MTAVQAFSGRLLVRIAWGVAAVLVVGLQLVAISRQSLIGDAPHHLLAGHQALRYGQNSLNLEHPPLVKLLAALPLLAEAQPLAPPTDVSRALEMSQVVFSDPARARRARLWGRLMLLAALALPFLAVCFLLGREVGGAVVGGLLALSLGLSLSTLPYLSLTQTDTAVGLGYVLTCWAGLRYLRRPRWRLALAMGAGLGIALAGKFSGVLLAPTLVLAVLLARGASGWGRRLVSLASALLVAVSILYVTYAIANRRYDSEAGRRAIRLYCRNQGTLVVEDQMQPYEALLLDVERVEPLLAQWMTGLIGIRIQDSIGVYPSYAFGSISSQGRWWFFPVLLTVKTPVVILLASFAALFFVVGGRRRSRPRLAPELSRERVWLLVFTALVYLGAAMSSSYNLGIRHLLPVLPLLYLPAVLWVARSRYWSGALTAILALEALALSPLWVSATNTWWLGPYNPTRFALSAGNNEFRQNFLVLRDELAERGIGSIRILYPLVSEAEMKAYIPGAVAARPGLPLEPGWYAVNVRVEQYIPAILRGSPEHIYQHDKLLGLARRWHPYWQQVAQGEDHGYVAATFHLYRLSGE